MTNIDILASELVKLNKNYDKKSETTSYGTIVQNEDKLYVKLDGASDEILTPIDTVSFIAPGDRVMVTIKNHTAIVTGNITKPSASNFSLLEVSEDLANKLSIDELQNEIGPLWEELNSKLDSSAIDSLLAQLSSLNSSIRDINSRLDAHDGFIYNYNVKPNILWSGSCYPDQNDSLNIVQNLSIQGRGIVLHWQPYNTNVQNSEHVYTFIPKTHATGTTITCLLNADDGNVIGFKTVTVYDDHIVGNASNSSGSSTKTSGLTTTNNYWMLTQILGI